MEALPIKTKILFLGGYLGAGKTTLALHLAKALNKSGKSVAVVMNDQGNVLVDTQFMENAGVDVREVIGACFCTKFDEFVKNARSLVDIKRPDIIIAEPIGTSTSLMSSVITPMKSQYGNEFQVLPLFVVVDGRRANDELAHSDELGLGDRKLIPIHQMHEAEFLVISKMDLLTSDESRAIKQQVSKEVPDAEIFEFSALDDRNLALLLEIINSDRETQKKVLAVDQRLFSMEKAAMGWYSIACKITTNGKKVDSYDLLMGAMKDISRRFRPEDIAHIKVLLSSPTIGVKISLVEDSIQVDGVKGGRYLIGDGEFVLNSRVRSMPEPLKTSIEKALEVAFANAGLTVMERKVACFTPKPDVPKFLL